MSAAAIMMMFDQSNRDIKRGNEEQKIRELEGRIEDAKRALNGDSGSSANYPSMESIKFTKELNDRFYFKGYNYEGTFLPDSAGSKFVLKAKFKNYDKYMAFFIISEYLPTDSIKEQIDNFIDIRLKDWGENDQYIIIDKYREDGE